MNQWEERFRTTEYLYGEEPNEFFKSELDKLPAGKIYLPGDGEGRNSCYAAQRGWIVDAVDFSIEAQKKALGLAKKKEVNINYEIKDLHKFIPAKDEYDVIASIFIHLPVEVRNDYHSNLVEALKSGGTLILETYSKEQLKYESGGPREESLLYDLEEVVTDLIELEFSLLEERIVNLAEGRLHNGKSSLINFVGVKS